MNISELLDTIESYEMAARVNAASGIRAATKIALTHPAVQGLMEEASKPEVADTILTRILYLSRQGVDVRYENPNDTAFLIYALVLMRRAPELAFVAAAVICQLPNLWWASIVAADILEGTSEYNDAATSSLSDWETDAIDRVFVWDPRSLLLWPPIHIAHYAITSTIADSATAPEGESEDFGGTRDVDFVPA